MAGGCRRGLASDLRSLRRADAVIKGLKHFRHRQHEVIVFHVLDDLERSFDFRHEARFIDLRPSKKFAASRGS
jgi:hypothetical protein